MQSELEHSPAPVLAWTGHTDRGKVRGNNEDSFLCLEFDRHELRYLGKVGEASTYENDFVFAVGDGMGGAMAGEFASRIAVDRIAHLLPRSFHHSASGFASGFEDLLEELFLSIHQELTNLGRAYEECRGMGTTLSLCWFSPGRMYFGHVGDSRIYYLPAQAEGVQQISHDDTHVGWLFRQGKISEREAKMHPGKSSLQKALGAGHQFVNPQVGTVAFQPGDCFLLCTDGVTDGLYDHQLARLLRDPEPHEASMPPAIRLVNAAVDISGRDNATAVVVEACEVPSLG